jgi:WD40 repeat protein
VTSLPKTKAEEALESESEQALARNVVQAFASLQIVQEEDQEEAAAVSTDENAFESATGTPGDLRDDEAHQLQSSEDNESFEDYDYLNPLSDGDQAIDDTFTDEELIATLNYLELPDEVGTLDTDFPSESEELPEIETDFDFYEDTLLEPIQDLDHVFDYCDTASDTSSPQPATSPTEEDIADAKVKANDNAALQLLEQLGSLQLDFQAQDGNLQLDFQAEDADEHIEDGLPPYLYCQPCQPEPPFADSQDDNPTLRHALKEEPLSDQDLDALLRLSVMSLESQLDDQDDLVQSGLGSHAATAPAVEELQSQRTTSSRPAALTAAKQYTEAFDVELYNANNSATSKQVVAAKMERTCIGHKERIMGLDVSECGRFLATASQDSTIRIWDTIKNALLSTLQEHRTDFECLRVAWASSSWSQDRVDRDSKQYKYLLASGGADGTVKLWGCNDPTDDSWKSCAMLDHASFNHFEPMDDNDKPQVYALQFIDHWQALPNADGESENSFLLTSSDDHVHLWEVDAQKKARTDDTGAVEKRLHLREVMSLRFTDLHDSGYGVHIGHVTTEGIIRVPADENAEDEPAAAQVESNRFGGDRNPQNLVYVFDAAYCAANGLLGAALSDGTLRLLNGRGVCLKLLQLPGVQSHLTSFGWDSTGSRLATCVATGHLITWSVVTVSSNDNTNDISIQTTCAAVMEGGHQAGRPLFGAAYCGTNDELLLSWGVDGRLCLWDSRSSDEIQAPLAVLVHKEDYPIYAVNMRPNRLCVGGGGNDGGFVGMPLFVYDVPGKDYEQPQASKKAKQTDETKPETATAAS